MSVTVSNCNQICNSPTNSSSSKMLYSFSKSARFPQRRQILCDKFYDPKHVSPSRSTTLGFGTKYDFTKDMPAAPPPNTYNLTDFFAKNAKKGFGFGEGREDMEVTGPLVETIHNRNPGPGSYHVRDTLSKQSFQISGKRPIVDKERMKVPGPGAYEMKFNINKNGEYFLAKYKNSCVRHFSKLDDRCQTSDSKVPGPGSYDTDKVSLSPVGKYCLSRMHSSLARRFGSAPRASINDPKNTPGPGNYVAPSEFGYYAARTAVKMASSRNKENFLAQ